MPAGALEGGSGGSAARAGQPGLRDGVWGGSSLPHAAVQRQRLLQCLLPLALVVQQAVEGADSISAWPKMAAGMGRRCC